MSRKEEIIQLLKEDANDVFLNYALALEYLAENKPESAKMQLEKVLQINSKYIPAYYQMGILLYQLNDKENSLEYLNKGLILSEENKDLKNIAEFKSAIMNIKNELL